jgi:hypothetical protein
MATTTTDCDHTNIEWLSGVPGVVVTLNGDIAARCLDCGATATMDTDDEDAPAAPLAHQWQSGRFTGTTTCQTCGLLPLDQDDIDTECPGA